MKYESDVSILVCGDRLWQDKYAVACVVTMFNPAVLIHGDCKGADRIAGAIGEAEGCKVLAFPADWDTYGPAAGPIRNLQMLNQGNPDIVVGFHDDIEKSKGTKHMLEIAKKAGKETYLYTHSKGLIKL